MTARQTLYRPADTTELSWRHATVTDIDAILDCARAMDGSDHPHFVTTREEIAVEFDHSYVDQARDSLLAIDRQNRVVAWGMTVLSPGQETLVRAFLFGGIRPDSRGRGIGRMLFEWQQERGLQQLASSDKTLPGWLLTFAEESAAGAAHLYDRFGFRVGRYFLQLTRDVRRPIDDRSLDDELRLLPFGQDWSEATMLARNNAFRDHWGSQPSTEEQWKEFVASLVFRPDLSFIAVGTNASGADEVAGLVLTSVNEEDWVPAGFSSGYIDLVGVAREWRNRGIASALLSRTLRAIADAGLERAVLDVDSESPTGALGLYTAVGFSESSRSMSFIREF